ncbi:HAD family hydrolase [Ammoniphilus resinae]|uniref:Phosphoglycolate phosphatase-like HAD superfamily hydrolase n=1 Tax=Ammoniphilus resinae TaxID=861532 RepID=A0ABS4GUF8_9BACL|nr:HAD hydrolase-like protein [Ammoniphilus resinae]MBP1933505.1 phosphoglycolate phosphatase-like HAD superfamily hydrolase [Ammoniphilus resinae]
MLDLILFDVDGVLLSEERYFDASALTVWEMLYSQKYLGIRSENFSPDPVEEEIRRIRKELFIDDQVLSLMKSYGINANWDMVYLSFSHQLIVLLQQLLPEHRVEIEHIITKEITRESIEKIASLLKNKTIQIDYASFLEDFSTGPSQNQSILYYLNNVAEKRLGIKTDVFSPTSLLWEICQETFQEWYLGDQLVPESIGRETYQSGKKGFLSNEIPIVPPERIAETLEMLRNKGIKLGIGTGRPTIETIIPLREMGLLSYFDPERIITASHVLDAESRFPHRAPMAKPHPFCYIKGWLGLQQDDEQVIDFQINPSDAKKLMIVGDSVADYLAAKEIGCCFAATLTGLTGQEARGKFEELQADFIVNDMTEIPSIL